MLCENEELIGIKEMLRKNPRGMSITDLSRELNLNRNSVAKYVNMLVVAGQVEMKTYAAAKVYFLSQRVPLTSMLDFSTDSCIILDTTLTVVRVNDNFLSLTGTTRENIIGKSLRETAIPIFSDPSVLEKIEDVLHGSPMVTGIVWQNPEAPLYLRGKVIPTAFEDGSAALMVFLENMTGQIRAQQALEKSEALYRAIVEDQTELVCRFQADGTLIFMNKAALQFFGLDWTGISTKSLRTCLPDLEWSRVMAAIRDLTVSEPTVIFDSCIGSESGSTRWVQWVVRLLGCQEGLVCEYQLVGRDVTELRNSTARIEQALREKETLLAENNYRIRSNLQFILSLIDLESEVRQEQARKGMLREERQQILALARIYEILTQSDDVNSIPLSRYLSTLGKDLYATYEIDPKRVRMQFRADDVPVDINTAIPIGLIFNELVSNAFKYAFPNGRSGQVTIGIRNPDSVIEITVADDGAGLPEDITTDLPRTVGMGLIGILVHQLNGRLAIDRTNGTRFTITIPYPDTFCE